MKISDRQAFYQQCIADGQSPAMAEIFASQRAPGIETDSSLLAGIGTLADQFDGAEDQLDYLVKQAKADGYTPKPSDYYCGSLATKAGDKNAWLNHDRGRSHVKQVCRQRGVGCQGAVKVASGPADPGPKVKLAESIIREKARQLVRRDPDKARLSAPDLKQLIVDTHARR